MTKQEVTKFMQRIKSHYQEFVIDEFKMNEWYNELKDYKNEDVNRKLEEHLKSQEYGMYVPKLYFLTKYLVKEKEQNLPKIETVECPKCHEYVLFADFDKHFDRCSSVDYVILKTKEYFNKELNRDLLMNMNQEEFDNKYNKLLNYIAKVTEDSKEQKRILNVFNPPNEFNLGEIL